MPFFDCLAKGACRGIISRPATTRGNAR
jgi:hypothetical protein